MINLWSFNFTIN